MAIQLSSAYHNRQESRQDADTNQPVSFKRSELAVILETYRRMVAAGEWRDYGISNLARSAVFSVYRNASGQPLYRIEKRPMRASRRNVYLIISMDNRIVRHGHDLHLVMRYFDRNLFRIVA